MADPDWKIQEACESDLLELMDLYKHLDPHDVDLSLDVAKERLRALQRYDESAVFVGFLNAHLIASCTLIVIPNLMRGGMPYALIENVVTHAVHRGQGYGKLLLKAATEAAWKAGCYKTMLMTGSSDPKTLEFYRSAGFSQNKTGFQMRRIPVRAE